MLFRSNVSTWLTYREFWQEAGFDVFTLDYRGFGRSTGQISSEAQLHGDVRAAWQSVAPGYAGKRLVIVGRSLGTNLAAHLSTEIPSDLLVLVSPYVSMQRMAHEQYAWVPGFLLRYPLHTDLDLPHTRAARTVILHGEQDALIPVAHAEALHALYPASQLVTVPNAGHSDIHQSPRYLQIGRAHV